MRGGRPRQRERERLRQGETEIRSWVVGSTVQGHLRTRKRQTDRERGVPAFFFSERDGWLDCTIDCGGVGGAKERCNVRQPVC